MSPLRLLAAGMCLCVLHLSATPMATAADELRTSRCDNGQSKQQSQYSNGLKHGLDRQYYPSGILQAEAYYDHGPLDGLQKTFTTTESYGGKRGIATIRNKARRRSIAKMGLFRAWHPISTDNSMGR